MNSWIEQRMYWNINHKSGAYQLGVVVIFLLPPIVAPRSYEGKEFPTEVDPRLGRLGTNLARPPSPIPRGVKWGADPYGTRPTAALVLWDLER